MSLSPSEKPPRFPETFLHIQEKCAIVKYQVSSFLLQSGCINLSWPFVKYVQFKRHSVRGVVKNPEMRVSFSE